MGLCLMASSFYYTIEGNLKGSLSIYEMTCSAIENYTIDKTTRSYNFRSSKIHKYYASHVQGQSIFEEYRLHYYYTINAI